MSKEQIMEEFKRKITTYDKDDGFIVYIEGYDNDDFNIELIEDFVSKVYDQTRQETIKEMNNEIENWEMVDGKSFTSDKIKHILNKLKQ